MKVLVVEPQKKPYVKDIDDTLESMQSVVGGLIEPVYIDDSEVVLVANEEGIINNLPFNRAIISGNIIQLAIFGTFFVCGDSENHDDFIGLSEDKISEYSERLIRVNNHYSILKYLESGENS